MAESGNGGKNMALDQFLMKIEEEFGVNLMAPAADEILTLVELIAYLEKFTVEMPHSQEEVDQIFQDGIEKLRMIIAENSEIDVSLITPKTELESILKPRSVRRRIWHKMRQDFSDDIPSLTSKAYRFLGGIVCTLVGILIACSIVIGQNPTKPNPMPIAVFLGIFVGAFAAFLLYAVTEMVLAPFFATIPKECRTLEEIVAYVIPTRICVDRNGQQWNRESIEKTVLKIAGKSSGIPAKDISLTMNISDI